jgi:pimeloyl-ACP methyl ester carboxylesterase
MYAPARQAQENWCSWHYAAVPKRSHDPRPAQAEARVRRGYFECRYGQLHVHSAMPSGGGFEEGTPLLCVQDFSGSGRIFRHFLALAGRERSVYAPDLPGFGESDPPPASVTIADYAAALGDFLDTMRVRQLAVLGLGTGVVLTTELAVARPAQVVRVVMVSVPQRSEIERHAAEARARAGEAVAEDPQSQHWALNASLDYPLREQLAKITQPLLVLRSRDEPSEATAGVCELPPGATVTELALGAAALFGAPQPLADAVRGFLEVT